MPSLSVMVKVKPLEYFPAGMKMMKSLLSSRWPAVPMEMPPSMLTETALPPSFNVYVMSARLTVAFPVSSSPPFALTSMDLTMMPMSCQSAILNFRPPHKLENMSFLPDDTAAIGTLLMFALASNAPE